MGSKVIRKIHRAGLTLAIFRNKTKGERIFAWMMIQANDDFAF
jgi:hypothetical protein